MKKSRWNKYVWNATHADLDFISRKSSGKIIVKLLNKSI